jgi:hypothetical protein
MFSCSVPFAYGVPASALITALECDEELAMYDWREGGTLKELDVGDGVESEFICTVASSVVFDERAAVGAFERDELRGTG